MTSGRAWPRSGRRWRDAGGAGVTRGARLRGVLASVLAIAVVAPACARVGSLPGGETDETPPRLVETVPEALSVGPVDGPVIFRFDERLSEQGVDNAVRVSPATGELRVERSGRELRVRLEGGWREDAIYYITVAPTLQDLFRNVRTTRTELVFSTGPRIQETAVAGLILDRLTGRQVEGAKLAAFRRADSTTYVAVADTAGFVALRYVPFGSYEVVAYVDQNRNERLDPLEQSSARAVVFLSEANDTSLGIYHLLPGDTTRARLMSAAVEDSSHVRLTFDDHLDPEQDPEQMSAALFSLPDTTAMEAELQLLRSGAFDAARQAARDSARRVREDSIFRARVDSIAAVDPDSAAALVAADSAQRAARAAAAEEPDPAAADSLPTPARELILRVQPPLQAGDTLVVRVSGVRNLNSIPDGGGQVILRVPEPPPPDTAAIPPAAAAAPPDTSGIPPAASGVPPDTAATSPATAAVRPPQPDRGRPHR